MPPKLSVVIPVYRSAASLFELHSRLRKVVDSSDEILFVNDACPDGSLEVLLNLVKIDPCVSVLDLDGNAGQNQAVMVGLAHTHSEIVVVMDADLQDPPEAIPRLLDALEDGIFAVFAGRRGKYESRTRLVTSRLLKVLLSMLSGGRIPADAGLFVMMRRAMVEGILAYAEPNPYVIGLMSRTGLRMISIPVLRNPDEYGVSAYSARMRLSAAYNAVRIALTPKPRLATSRGNEHTPPVHIKGCYGSRSGSSKMD